jgi:hypothetical protein
LSDCHAEIESRSNMGRRFTALELKAHRDRWFMIVENRPEVLIRAAQNQNEAGPLEALLAELAFNRLVVADGTEHDPIPPLATEQFRRVIATNALAALPSTTRESVHRAYSLTLRVNYRLDEMARMDRSGGAGGAWAFTREDMGKLKLQLRDLIPTLVDNLERALGRSADR